MSWQDPKRRQAEREEQERVEKRRQQRREQEQENLRALLKIVGLFSLAAAIIFGGVQVYRKAIRPHVEAQNRIEAARATYNPGRFCTTEREDVDYFDMGAADLPHGSFTYRPANGCWAKIVLPKVSNHWSVQTAGVETPTDWLAIGCIGGRVLLPPISPNAPAPFGSCGGTARESHTYLIQGNTTLMWVAKDIPAETKRTTGRGQVTSHETVKQQDPGVPPLPKPHDFRDDYHNRVCTGALDKDKEMQIDGAKQDHITVTLVPGCFSPIIYLPKEWTRWQPQIDPDGWVAIMRGSKYVHGPWQTETVEREGSYAWDPDTSRIRVQGKGSLTIFQVKSR